MKSTLVVSALFAALLLAPGAVFAHGNGAGHEHVAAKPGENLSTGDKVTEEEYELGLDAAVTGDSSGSSAGDAMLAPDYVPPTNNEPDPNAPVDPEAEALADDSGIVVEGDENVEVDVISAPAEDAEEAGEVDNTTALVVGALVILGVAGAAYAIAKKK